MNLQMLRDKIIEGFNLAELRSLCFDLNIEYENLEGVSLNEKVIELVKSCGRQSCFPELVARCKELRPRISWREVVDTIEQWPPKIREDKLAFLCWVYIKSEGRIFQFAQSDDIANLMKLSQIETARVAQYLVKYSLLDFSNWYMGIKITHQGILKTESDLLQGFIRDDFPQDIIPKIQANQRKRLDFLHSLYKKSKPIAFEPISGIEIANAIGSDHHQLVAQGFSII